MPEPRELILVRLDDLDEPPAPSRKTIDPDRVRELADSMARLGLLQPIGVEAGPLAGRYTVCYGHRRLLAARSLGWFDIPAVVLPPGAFAADAQLAENLHRAELTPVEEALSLRRLSDDGRSAGAIAHVVRKSEAWVTARLSLLRYPDDLQSAIHEHGLPLSVAALLAQIDDDGYRTYLIREAIAHGATANTARAWLQHYLANRDQLRRNQATVEEIAASRDTWRVIAPCEYCGEPSELEHTRAWRLCRGCSEQLARVRDTPPGPPESQPARQHR